MLVTPQRRLVLKLLDAQRTVIYTKFCLKSVCLSVCLSACQSAFADCRSQFLLDRLGKCQEFVSKFGLAFCLYAKNVNKLFTKSHSRASFYCMKRGETPDSLVIDRPCPTITQAVNVVSSDRVSQQGENNKSKRRQRELIPSRLKKCGLGMITYNLRSYSVCKNQQ